MGEAVIILYILGGFIGCIITGFLSLSLQSQKGYEGGFWIGFLLGIIGLIYSAGLPDKSKKIVREQDGEQVIETAEENDAVFEEVVTDCEGKDFIYCSYCKFPIYNDEKNCANCGSEKKSKSK